MKKWEKLLLALCITILIALVGCASFQDVITPCIVDEDVAEYADEPATTIFPWSTLWDAGRIKKKMDYVHQMNQIMLDRQIEDDNLKYAYLLDAHQVHLQDAAQFRDSLFNPQSPLGMLLPAGLGLTVGGMLIPRSKDKKKIVELEKANGKTEKS